MPGSDVAAPARRLSRPGGGARSRRQPRRRPSRRGPGPAGGLAPVGPRAARPRNSTRGVGTSPWRGDRHGVDDAHRALAARRGASRVAVVALSSRRRGEYSLADTAMAGGAPARGRGRRPRPLAGRLAHRRRDLPGRRRCRPARAGAARARPRPVRPVVRARLAALDGQPTTRALVEQRRGRGDDGIGYFTRDYVLTAASALPAGNVVTVGHWWSDGATAAHEASVEEAAARHLGLAVGSSIAFDVQGVRLEARVTSLRQVDWQSLTTNFFVILSPGTLDGAPTSYVATARVAPNAEAAVQDAVVQALPNVTAIPLRDVLERLGRVLDQMAVAVRTMALFAISAGLVVMAGALGASRYQRLVESVILRTLGATRSTVARVFAVEYACLGLAA